VVEQASKANDVIMKGHSDNGEHEIGNESTVADRLMQPT